MFLVATVLVECHMISSQTSPQGIFNVVAQTAKSEQAKTEEQTTEMDREYGQPAEKAEGTKAETRKVATS